MRRFSTLFLAVIFVMSFTAIGLAVSESSAVQETVVRKTKNASKKTYHKGHYVTRRVWVNGRYVTRRVWVKGKWTGGKIVKGTRWTTHKTKRGAKKVYNKVIN